MKPLKDRAAHCIEDLIHVVLAVQGVSPEVKDAYLHAGKDRFDVKSIRKGKKIAAELRRMAKEG